MCPQHKLTANYLTNLIIETSTDKIKPTKTKNKEQPKSKSCYNIIEPKI